jgi:glucose/arabinose dehydrogenase
MKKQLGCLELLNKYRVGVIMNRKLMLGLGLLNSALLLLSGPVFADGHGHKTAFKVTEIATGLKNPWGIAFLPNGDALITERSGGLRKLSVNGELGELISGLPKAEVKGQGGFLGLAVHPDFAQNQMVYVCLNVAGEGGAGSEVHAGILKGNELIDTKPIFIAQPKSDSGHHFGCRVTFDNNKDVFISLGDRGKNKEQAQDPTLHTGKVVKVKANGDIPSNNPFVGKDGADEVYTYGHRNVQGMTLHPKTGAIWTHEHGPKGGDEVNILSAGDNYGWPVITYGVNYNGSSITDKTEMQGMRQPLTYWDPSIAPSGMDFYDGEMFSDWQGNLFVGSLKFRYLLRMELDENNKVIAEHKLLEDRDERIRDVVQGPDGSIYVLTDSTTGKVLKLTAN